jgi:hypothetical protein
MVTLLYKWLIIPMLSLGLVGNAGNSSYKAEELINDFSGIGSYHPIHISTLEIEHNTAEKSLEITCKIFWDDFETILTKSNNSKRVDLTNEKNLANNKKLVSAYISNHLSLLVDGKPITLNFVGFEKDDAVIFSYFEVTNISNVKKISITNNLMYDMFDDQIEIIHVIVNGNRKSTKLEYPAKQAEFSF